MKPLKNQWGSVKPYTRHNSTCTTPDVDGCSCPKWLYVRKRNEQDVRYALNTPSWAEALEKATDKLTALNPEIAESREARVKHELSRKTIYEAINLWLDRTRTLYGEDAQIVKQYRSTFGWVDGDGVKRGALLRYATDRQFEYVDELPHSSASNGLTRLNSPAKPPTANTSVGVRSAASLITLRSLV